MKSVTFLLPKLSIVKHISFTEWYSVKDLLQEFRSGNKNGPVYLNPEIMVPPEQFYTEKNGLRVYIRSGQFITAHTRTFNRRSSLYPLC